ncbi:MAG: M20/M25/M40 family metallo-hydrolase [Bacilli bacterium]|nr:M20/M25/M40 family metallo-hydrolase [Bacilli bacterium]
MERIKNEDFLCKLLKTPSPSGYELEIQKLVIDEMKGYADKVYTHQNYNVIHAINVDSKMKVLLSGHIDEIGLVINEIKDNGTCKVERTGGVRSYMYLGQHVEVITHRDGKVVKVPGVFGYLPDMGKREINVSDLVLDLGTKSKEESLKLVSVGDPVIHMNDYVQLNGTMFSARALDDRLGAFICLETLKRVKERGSKNGVYVSTTVGEETTGRGAMAAAYQIKPTCAIIIDVTYANDLPYRENLSGTVALGKGPALCIGSEMNKVMFERMKQAAKNLNMEVQFEIAPARTFTDTDDIYHSEAGIPSYLVSIPLRYMHSSVEVCDLKDSEDIIELLTEFICELDSDTSFDPFK